MQGFYENHRDVMDSARAWYTQNDHFVPHFHNSIELMYVLEGELIGTLDAREYRAGKNTMLVSSSYAIHSYETPQYCYSIVAIIPLSVVASAKQIFSTHAFAYPLCVDDEGQTLGMLMKMLVENEKNALAVKGACYAILGLLMERLGVVEVRMENRGTFIRSVLEYLEQHHTEPLSATQIAAHFGYSRSRFSYLFNAHLGYSLSDYLGAIRCRHAAKLLRETDMAVSDVAMAVGFESLRTFYRTFKNQYEMTPGEYAKG